MLPIPEIVRARALSQGAASWLAGLDDLVADLGARWGLELGGVLGGGTAALVLRCRCADGTPAALKVSVPECGFDDQLRLLELADGRGYVRVLRSDPDHDAALLEWLGPPLAPLIGNGPGDGPQPEDQLGVLGPLLRLAWRLPREDYRDQDWDKAEQLATMITSLWDKHDHPCSAAVIDRALDCASRRAAVSRDRWVVVHGDPHPGNALAVPSGRPGAVGGYVFVDPDGFLADPAYDVGVTLRDWSAWLLTGDAKALQDRYCRVGADRTGIDQRAIAEWAYLERVSSGLFVLDVGEPDRARRFLDTAELLL